MLKIFQIVVLILVTFGCASVHKASFLDPYDTLRNGRYLERVSISRDLNSIQDFAIEVKNPSAKGAGQHAFFPPSEVEEYLLSALLSNLDSVGGIKVYHEGAKKPSANYLVLETAVTELEPGSKFGRFMAGELGMGHSHIQVEGRLINPIDNKVLFAFVDRRAGSAMGGMDITGGDPRTLVEDDLEGISNSLAKTLASLK